MRIVIQRVSHAQVTIEGKEKSSIRQGYLILVGIEQSDNEEDVHWLVRKVIGLRVFDDEQGVMNRSILDVGGNILVVSQFTLMASYKKATDRVGSELPATSMPSPSISYSAMSSPINWGVP